MCFVLSLFMTDYSSFRHEEYFIQYFIFLCLFGLEFIVFVSFLKLQLFLITRGMLYKEYLHGYKLAECSPGWKSKLKNTLIFFTRSIPRSDPKPSCGN